MTKKKSKMAEADVEEFESWQPSRRIRIPSTPSPGTEHGRHDSPIRSLIQTDLTPSATDDTGSSKDQSPSEADSLELPSAKPSGSDSPDKTWVEDLAADPKPSQVRTTPEHIPMEMMGKSPKFNSMHNDSPEIFRRRTPSTDPSMTLDSVCTMNASMYSTGSNTYTGTLKRGKKSQIVEVQLQLTPAEIDKLNRSTISENLEKGSSAVCSSHRGIHILLLSVLYFPLALVSSLVMSLYVCTMCWYNIYLCLSEERTIWHKIFLCPLIIVFFPMIISVIPVCVAVYAAFRQLSWSWSRWSREIRDFEKGVFGGICTLLKVPECSPYEVIILNENGSTAMLEEPAPGTPV